MYRAGQLSLPDYCSVDTPFSECHATCDSYSDIDTYWETMFAWWEDVDDFDWLTDTLKMGVVDMMCDGGIGADGDQLESGSPMDPSFWSIHPTMERLLHYKMLADPFVTKEWKAYGDISMTSYCEYSTTTDCKGHHGYDLTAFKSMVLDVETGDYAPAYLTNGEIFDHMSLEDYKMSYYYEDFSWPHCEARGVVFPAVSS